MAEPATPDKPDIEERDAADPDESLTVVQALNRVMRDVTVLRKLRTSEASRDRYQFRGIDDTMNALGPAFRRHGLVVIPTLVEKTHEIVVTKGGSNMTSTRVTVDFTFYGPQGDTLGGRAPGEAFDSGDKSTAKAMSVALRTFLLQSFLLPTDEPDPDEHVYELEGQQRPAEQHGRSGGTGGRQQDAFAVNELVATQRHRLGELIRSDDEDTLRAAYYEVKEMQDGGTVYHVRPGTDLTKDEAAVLNITGPYLDLLEVVARISKHYQEEACSVRDHLRLDASDDPANQPTPMGSGDAEAARDAADAVRLPSEKTVQELRKAARGQNGGQQG